MLVLRKDGCNNYQAPCGSDITYNFLKSNVVDFNDLAKKVRDTGFFGLFDKTKMYANSLNDLHYLLMKLQMIHKRKIEDSVNCSSQTCNFSNHPAYYIYHYKLDCIFKSFQCKGIDITPYLIAYNIHKVYKHEKLYYSNDKRIEDCFSLISPESYPDCPQPIEDTTPIVSQTYEPICCIVPPTTPPTEEVPEVVIPPQQYENTCVYVSPENILFGWQFPDEGFESFIGTECGEPGANTVFLYLTSFKINGVEWVNEFKVLEINRNNIRYSEDGYITNFYEWMNDFFCENNLIHFQANPWKVDWYEEGSDFYSVAQMAFYLTIPLGATIEMTIESTNCELSSDPVADSKFTYHYTNDNFNLPYISCEETLPTPEITRFCPDNSACCIPYWKPKESDWLFKHLTNFIETCEAEVCAEAFTFNENETDDDFFTFNINENNNCEDSFTFNLNEQNC